MPAASMVVSSLVAPVVMISACALLCLALYNRLAAIVSRARAFNKERHELQMRLHARHGDPEGSLEMRERSSLLSHQVDSILRRGHLIRSALLGLLLAILLMLGCSMGLGFSIWWPESPLVFGISLGCFGAGVVTMACSVILAALELEHALGPAATEWHDTK